VNEAAVVAVFALAVLLPAIANFGATSGTGAAATATTATATAAARTATRRFGRRCLGFAVGDLEVVRVTAVRSESAGALVAECITHLGALEAAAACGCRARALVQETATLAKLARAVGFELEAAEPAGARRCGRNWPG